MAENLQNPAGLVAKSRREEHLRLWALVLASGAIPHWLEMMDDQWGLFVDDTMVGQARQQIILYEQENRHWPLVEKRNKSAHHYNPPTVLIMALFVCFFAETDAWSAHNAWFVQGSLDRLAVLDHHQWWRLVTALTLHADSAHLAGNVIIGGIIIHFLTKSIGTGLGWFLLFAVGALANGVNIFFHSHEHHAVGLSTAVFAAIGMISSLELMTRTGHRGRLLALGAGAALVALFSSSEARVDVGAHLWGGVCGLLVGVFLGGWQRMGKKFPGATIQNILLLLTMLVVWLNWWVALNLS